VELATFAVERKMADHTPVVLAPISDLQWAGERGPTAKDLLKRHIDRCLELNAWYLGLGDYIDFMSPSNRQRMRSAALYDTAEDVVDDKALELTWELYEKFLKPTKGRWLGMLHGHHYTQLRSGETTDQRLCQMLDAPFLGTSAYIRLQFKVTKSQARGNIVIWAHHGCGGGQKAGAPLGKIEDMAAAFPGADIYLMGHTTKSPVAPIERVIPRWHGQGAPDLVHKRVYLVNSGGFARGYQKGATQGSVPMGGYVEQGMMRPASLGAPIIRITPLRSWAGRTRGHTSGMGTWTPTISVEV
jgi:hypothetical protein